MRLIDLDEFLRQNCIDRIEGKSCEECKHHVLEVSCERLMEQPTIDPKRGKRMSDLISREAAIEALGERPTVWTDDDQYTLGERNQYDIDRLAIETLPSAEKVGKWIYCEDSMANCVDGYKCDQCGVFVPWDYQHKGIDYINDYHYCPNCGARMEGEDDEQRRSD